MGRRGCRGFAQIWKHHTQLRYRDGPERPLSRSAHCPTTYICKRAHTVFHNGIDYARAPVACSGAPCACRRLADGIHDARPHVCRHPSKSFRPAAIRGTFMRGVECHVPLTWPNRQTAILPRSAAARASRRRSVPPHSTLFHPNLRPGSAAILPLFHLNSTLVCCCSAAVLRREGFGVVLSLPHSTPPFHPICRVSASCRPNSAAILHFTFSSANISKGAQICAAIALKKSPWNA